MTAVTNDIRYVGVNDHKIDLFEGQYIVPNGMAYSAPAIMSLTLFLTIVTSFLSDESGNGLSPFIKPRRRNGLLSAA